MNTKLILKKLFTISLLLTIFTTTVNASELQISQQTQDIINNNQASATPTDITELNSLKLTINNQQTALNNALIYNNRTFLKVREITDKIGANISYLQPTETIPTTTSGIALITFTQDQQSPNTITLEIPIGYSQLTKIVNNKSTNKIISTSLVNIDTNDSSTKSFAYNSYTYLPLRAVFESLNYKVTYDSTTSTIFITPQPSESDNGDGETVWKGEPKPNYNGTKTGELSPQGNWRWQNRLQKWFPDKTEITEGTADGNDGEQILH